MEVSRDVPICLGDVIILDIYRSSEAKSMLKTQLSSSVLLFLAAHELECLPRRSLVAVTTFSRLRSMWEADFLLGILPARYGTQVYLVIGRNEMGCADWRWKAVLGI